MDIASVTAIISAAVTVLTLLYAARDSIKKNRDDIRARAETETQHAVEEATAPYRDRIRELENSLAAMTKDRDYERARKDELNDFIRDGYRMKDNRD